MHTRKQPARNSFLASGGAEVPRSQVINYCLGARVPARAASKAQCPPSRPPALRGKS